MQALVWVFALPVPVWLWAVQLPNDRRAPALTFAVMVTAFCLAVPIAGGVGERRTAAAVEAARLSSTTTSVSTSEPTPTTTAPTTGAPTTAPPTTAQPTISAPVTAAPTTAAPATTTAASLAGEVPALIDQLSVAPEADQGSYDRELFAGWVDADDDGCDTRCEVLAAERDDSLPGLPGGGWLSAYDGYTTPDSSELEIDHLVPLGEAWRSGASRWDPDRRAAFANDLDAPETLVAVSAATNRSKSDSDPSEWQPPNTASWCSYVGDWVTVKLRWGLTADPGEVAALANMAAGC